MYIQPLSDLLKDHGFDFQKYADDTQLFKSALPEDIPTLLCTVEKCISSVKDWMLRNKLKLNDGKTEAMCVASAHTFSKVNPQTLNAGDCEVPFQSSVRDLGVLLDSSLSMHGQVSAICKNAYFQLRKIRSISSLLPQSAVIQLVVSLTLSRVVYCRLFILHL